MKRNITQRFILCGVCLMMTGCSTFGFLFERFDWLALWKLDQMFNLSDQQKEQLQPQIKQVHIWLRQEGIPLAINSLYKVRAHWDAGELSHMHEVVEESTQSLALAFMQASLPVIKTLSIGLTESNTEHYRQYNKNQQDDWFSASISKQNKIDKTEEGLEDLYGHLTDAQMDIIENWAEVQPNEYAERVINHDAWVDAFIDVALSNDLERITLWASDPTIFWTEEYKILHKRYAEERQALVKQLFPTLSKKQRQKSSSTTTEWIKKLEALVE